MKKKTNILILILVLLVISFASFSVYAGTYSNYNNGGSKLFCGGSSLDSALISDIPSSVPKITHIFYIGLQIIVPILLIIFGMVDLIKGLISGKEDEMKKNQMTLFRRLAMGALVFFVFTIVKLVVNVVADNNNVQILECVDCFLNNNTSSQSVTTAKCRKGDKKCSASKTDSSQIQCGGV